MLATQPRPRSSVFPEVPERPVVGITPFDWQRDYRQTWTACPSAFWLAPDAADVLPAADLLTPAPASAASARTDTTSFVPRVEQAGDRAPGVCLAIVAAGPVFVGIGGSAAAIGTGTIHPGALVGYLGLLPIISMVGVLLSVLPVAFGSWIVGRLGERLPMFRRRGAWMMSGAVLGGLIGGIASGSAIGMAWMAATGAACAGIARWKVRWAVPDQLRGAAESTRTPAVAINACPAK